MGRGGEGRVRRKGKGRKGKGREEKGTEEKGREGRESDISKQITLINTHFFQFLAIAA